MNGSVASTLLLTTTERVFMGLRAADALSEEVARLGATRVFLLVSSSLRHDTDEIEQIQAALGDKIVAVYDGIPPHAPRTAVLSAAAVLYSMSKRKSWSFALKL